MRYNPVLAAASSLVGLAPSVAAFLITPEMTPATKDAKSVVQLAPDRYYLDPQCHSCPVWQEVDGWETRQTPQLVLEAQLFLDFHVDDNQLRINDAPVFPFKAAVEGHKRILSDVVLPPGPHGSISAASSLEPVDFVLDAQKLPLSDDGDELIIIDLTILGLGGIPANVQPVQLKLIQTEGQLFIVDAELMPFNPSKSEAEMCDTARNQRLCKLRAAIHDQFRQMMDVANKHTSNIKDWMKTHAPGNKPRPCPGAMRPHGDRYGNPHRHDGPHHHRGFRPAHWLFVVTKTFLIPAALGVVAGIGVSLIGMIVGRLIVMLWVHVVRGGRQGNVDNVRIVEVQIEEDEKTGLMEVVDEDAPPAYADEIVIVEQEKH